MTILEWITNQFDSVLSIAFLFFLVVIIFIIIMRKNITIKRKGNVISLIGKNNDEYFDKRDIRPYLFYTEKVEELMKEYYRLRNDLASKQVLLFNDAFEDVLCSITSIFWSYLNRYIKKLKIKLSSFHLSNVYLNYQHIIQEILKENYTSIHAYIKKNDLWRYEKNREEYIKGVFEKYFEKNIKKFNLVYTKEKCLIPKEIHNKYIRPIIKKDILKIIHEMKSKLIDNSIEAHVKEKIINEEIFFHKYFGRKDYIDKIKELGNVNNECSDR